MSDDTDLIVEERYQGTMTEKKKKKNFSSDLPIKEKSYIEFKRK